MSPKSVEVSQGGMLGAKDRVVGRVIIRTQEEELQLTRDIADAKRIGLATSDPNWLEQLRDRRTSDIADDIAERNRR